MGNLMKNLNILFLLLLGAVAVWSCTEEERTVISDNPGIPVLNSPASGQSIVLSEETGSQDLVFSFDPADFGYSAAVSYTVQLAESGTSFQNPLDVGTSNGSDISISEASLNQRLIGRGYDPDESIQMDVRVRASVGDAVEPVFSSVSNISVTPYSEALVFAKMFVPGDYQGWSPENENTVIYSVNNDNIFEGYVHILGGSGAFKVTEEPNWDINYGGANGTLERDGPDFVISEPFGTFRLKVDLNSLTYEIGTRRRWGIIGDATPLGWDGDTPMDFDSDENVLTITIDLVEGNFKFRAGDWAFNYGDTGLDGILDPDGADIPISEDGNYTITMDWKVPGEISYEVVKND
ncbi:hypothetical protein A33Q_1614 [Indibacter alkaliphilus LW1]|uniref:SusE outer membrane protein domain-containing protein n=2 Tax=Indibacter TaxID=647744 RepID=S2DKQ4_INDAL|nr:hypothetical protein A33Q_1614 [Indibacter alkaliphilus LW1]